MKSVKFIHWITIYGASFSTLFSRLKHRKCLLKYHAICYTYVCRHRIKQSPLSCLFHGAVNVGLLSKVFLLFCYTLWAFHLRWHIKSSLANSSNLWIAENYSFDRSALFRSTNFLLLTFNPSLFYCCLHWIYSHDDEMFSFTFLSATLVRKCLNF